MKFDKKFAQQLIGKSILIGVNIINSKNIVESRQQMFGIVFSVSEQQGILINLKGDLEGNEWLMPPDTRRIKAAEPGDYKLIDSSSVIRDPDFLCNLDVQRDESK